MKNHSPQDFGPGTVDFDSLQASIAITCFGACRKLKTKAYFPYGKKARKHMKGLRKKGNPNHLHLEQLIEAEYVALKSDRASTATKHFQSAIVLAARNGSLSDQALINERFGDFVHECGDIDEAVYRWKTAVLLYREWSASAKVDQVEMKLSKATSSS